MLDFEGWAGSNAQILLDYKRCCNETKTSLQHLFVNPNLDLCGCLRSNSCPSSDCFIAFSNLISS